MSPPPLGQQSIRDAIAHEESRLLRLEEELTQAQTRLAALKTTLAAQSESIETASSTGCSRSAPSTAPEKVALFRSRFRGRVDIYPRLWTNARRGRKGYAPACGNEWVRGICEKPRLKRGECPNQAFLPVDYHVILDHLQGRHLAMPISWKGTLVQYAGRLHRLYPGKTEVRIYDYVDREIPMLGRMFEMRLRGYRAIGYARGAAPVTREQVDDDALEFDESAAAE